MTPIRAVRLAAITPSGAELDAGAGRTCRVSFLAPDLARVLWLRDGKPRQSRTWMVPAHGAADTEWQGRDRLDDSSFPTPPLDVAATDDGLTLATPALVLHIAYSPFAMTWTLPDGRLLARDRPQGTLFAPAGGLAHAHARHALDRYYGLGDKTGPLDLHGRRLRIAMRDSLGFDPERGDPLYKHWPFLIVHSGESGAAHGLFYDNGAEAAFDLGCEHDNYFPPFRTYEAEAGDLDYYLFPGPAIADVTRKFLALTGPTALPPRWTLGFAQTAMAIADSPDAQARMHAWIARCAAEAIPVSAFHFGSGYTMIGPRRYVFNWNRDKYPDPEALLAAFHAAGIHVVANVKPCLLDSHPRYAEIPALAIQGETGPAIAPFWDGEGAHLDFTNPAAIAWWQAGLRAHVLAQGFDIAWNDNNEYGFKRADAACAGFGTPEPLDLLRPVQPLLMTRASTEAQTQARPALRNFSVTRAGCPGIQRYAQTWSGDNSTSWRSLKWNLRTGLQMSLSGMLNIGHDVGGFSGPIPDPELLIRWTQAGSIHPRFIMNSWKPDGVYTAPWLHESALPMIRDAIRLRYRLIPYLYSLMHAATRGELPLRPTFITFPDDPACAADTDALMLGPCLLAIPVTEPGARQVAAYLPAGPECWWDFHTNERLEAGSTATIAAPLDRLPLAVPAGAILPTTTTDGTHDEPSRTLRLYPGPHTGTTTFTLTEDDGETATGPATNLAITLAWTPTAVHLTIHMSGDYTLPYDHISLALPPTERRPLAVTSDIATDVIQNK